MTTPPTAPADASPQDPAAQGAGKLAIPDAAAQAKAEKLLRTTYAADFNKHAPADRQALAEKLLTLAGQTSDDPAGRYVLLSLARDLAGRATTALAAVDGLSTTFQVDAAALKLETLTRFSGRSSLSSEDVSAIVKSAQAACDEAVAAEQWAAAQRMLTIVRTASRAAHDSKVGEDLKSWLTETQATLAAAQRVAPSLQKLTRTPDDKDANTQVGHFYCFTLGNWDKGLVYLSHGNDPALSTVARQDVAARSLGDSPDDSAALAKVANAWWAAADAAGPTLKPRLRLRAVDQYRRALAGATGLEKTVMEQRIAQMAGSNASAGAASSAHPATPNSGHTGAAAASTVTQLQPADGGLVVHDWLICGPFGGPGAEKFKRDPDGTLPGTNTDMKRAVRDFCEAATYPPDSAAIDPSAAYTGDMVKGYWPAREVRWKPATIADGDTRVTLGEGGQTWYSAAWIRAPFETKVEFQFQGHKFTAVRCKLNGQNIPLSDFKDAGNPRLHLYATRQTVTLRAGWNEVRLRSYNWGYAPFRMGLIINAPAETLRKLSVTGTPPSGR